MLKTRALFVTGTDTGVGKTYVTSMLARELLAAAVNVGACKPVCSGSAPGPNGLMWEDVEALYGATRKRFPRERICPQTFAAPLAPPVAAKLAGTAVDRELLHDAVRWWNGRVDLLLIEGVGGLLCPLTEDETIAEFARDLGVPLLIVGRLGLGTINHTLLTIEAARSRNLAIAGVILNQTDPDQDPVTAETNPLEIQRRSGVPVLGMVKHGQAGGLLRNIAQNGFDLASLAGPLRD